MGFMLSSVRLRVVLAAMAVSYEQFEITQPNATVPPMSVVEKVPPGSARLAGLRSPNALFSGEPSVKWLPPVSNASKPN
jgi:hypothetical protein